MENADIAQGEVAGIWVDLLVCQCEMRPVQLAVLHLLLPCLGRVELVEDAEQGGL